MDDNGTTKDDVKLPEGEAGDKITKLFVEDGKDTSKHWSCSSVKCHNNMLLDVIVLTSMGEEIAMDAKEAPKN